MCVKCALGTAGSSLFVYLLQGPELSPHTENTELRQETEERKSAGLEDEKNPKKSKVMVEEVVAKEGENKDQLSSEKSRESEECTQHHPGPQ